VAPPSISADYHGPSRDLHSIEETTDDKWAWIP
jgi:hypothetical protein